MLTIIAGLGYGLMYGTYNLPAELGIVVMILNLGGPFLEFLGVGLMLYALAVQDPSQSPAS